jgi:ribonuclease HI
MAKTGRRRPKEQTAGRRIAARLKPLYVEFRKVKGHSDDERNDVADGLAVKGRDEA